MGRIRKPQSLSSLWKLVPQDNPELFFNLLNKYKVTDSKGKYYHWDKFKWRVKEGDDEKLAWLATKIARRAVSKPLTILQAQDQSCFSYCLPNSLLAQLHKLVEADLLVLASTKRVRTVRYIAPPNLREQLMTD